MPFSHLSGQQTVSTVVRSRRESTAPAVAGNRRPSPAKELSKRWRFFPTYAEARSSPVLRQSFLRTRVTTNVGFDACRPAFRQNAAAPDGRVDQALRQFSRQRRYRYRYLAAANPRPARRKRRGKIDALRQNRLRIDPAKRGRDTLARRENGSRRAIGSPQPRHRHGIPALLAVRQSHRRRERGARSRRQGIIQGYVRTAAGSLQCLRASARSEARSVAAVGG